MEVTINPITRAEVVLLHQALTRLSNDLGDAHVASLEALTAAGFGPTPA